MQGVGLAPSPHAKGQRGWCFIWVLKGLIAPLGLGSSSWQSRSHKEAPDLTPRAQVQLCHWGMKPCTALPSSLLPRLCPAVGA